MTHSPLPPTGSPLQDHPVTVITGASKGIGRFLVEHYLAHGHRVAGCSRQALPEEIPGYEHFSLDVADEQAVNAMMNQVRQKYGRLDHLINNAGIAATGHSLLTPAETVLRVYQTNVIGTFLFSREAAKLMKKSRSGRIVNFSSAAVPLKLAGEALYGSSKAAIVSLTEILARELAPFGITVNTVGPTPIQTDLIRAMPADKVQQVIDSQPIKRAGTFDDVANVIDFFLRPESDFITGQVIYLGGF
jgi:3-oxoacyl-[acyl-carrier protein] reductase